MNEVKWEVSHFPNGQKHSETPYVNGQRHGAQTWWYRNGQKYQDTPWVNGQLHGMQIWWYDDGSLLEVYKWDQGQLVVKFEFEPGIVPAGVQVEVNLLTNKCLVL